VPSLLEKRRAVGGATAKILVLLALAAAGVAIAVGGPGTHAPSPAPSASGPSSAPSASPSSLAASGPPLAQSAPPPSALAPSAPSGALSAAFPLDPPPLDELGRPQLDRAAIQRVLVREEPDIHRRCWEPALRSASPGAPTSTRLVIVLTIAPSGAVDSATVSEEARGYPALAECVAARVRTWKLPAAQGQTTVTIPFVFSSHAGPAPARDPGTDLPAFDKPAAAAALQRAAAEAGAKCRRSGAARVSGQVVVTLAPTGRVTRVDASQGELGGSPVGACVEGIFRKMTVPPFSGGLITIARSVAVGVVEAL